MDASQLIYLLIVFVVVGGVAAACLMIVSPRPIRDRLDTFADHPASTQLENSGWVERVAKVAEPFTRLSLPEEGWEKSALRTRFMNAGWRTQSAPTLYFASKTVLALGLPALVALALVLTEHLLAGQRLMLVLFVCASAGYYLPNLVLTRLVRRRQRDIFESIPDALDLLTVCVEAGLSLERALIKVAGEIHIKSLVLAQELQLVLMEMRAGFSKEKALRNFALRTGVEDVDTLVVMLIQSERFGTSMGAALRVHADNLRTKRRLIAEESAAKIALKLMFPLIFCIFPTVLMVLIGPAMIQIVHTLMPTLAGTS
ncbi:type II secretion system F family protein [Massilia sp. PWRC2]|uniref:type II secretion system F family protein n=1 Tax=Massilia sp. PWRC2 TaxID=2804626 RepID=UPI003CF2609F